MRTKVKWLSAAAAVSVGLNLFLGGVIAARLGDVLHPRAARPVAAGFQANVRKLPQPERRLVARTMRAKGPELRELRRKLAADGDEVRAAMRDPAFDPTRLDRAFAAVRQDTTAVQAVVHGQLAQAIGQLDPAARAVLAEPPPPKDR